MPDEFAPPDISPDAIARSMGEGSIETLAHEVMLAHEERGWKAFVAAVVGLHNSGAGDVLRAAASCEGPVDWAAERLYAEALPMLDASSAAMLEAVVRMGARSRDGAMPYYLQNAFSEWCDRALERCDAGLDAIRSGEAPRALLIPTLAAGVRVARARYLEILALLLDDGAAGEDEAAAFVLGNVDAADAGERQLQRDALLCALGSGATARRSAALRAALALGTRDASAADLAVEAIDAVEADAAPEDRAAGANALFMARKAPTPGLVARICDLLRGTPPGEPATVDAIDYAIAQHLSGATAAPRLTLLRDLLVSGAVTISALDGTAHYLLVDKGDVLREIVAGWLAEGDERLVTAVHDLVVAGVSSPPRFVLDFSAHLLDAESTAAIGRRAVSSLILFPETAASIVLSLLRTGHGGAAADLEEILFDPLLISYWNGPRTFLVDVAGREDAAVAQAITRVVARLDDYVAAIREAGIVRELGPSERRRFLYQMLRQEEQRSISKGAGRKSIFSELFATKALLYGDSAVGQVHHVDGRSTREEFRLGTVEHSQEIARLDAIDPLGFWYQRVLFSMGRTP